jgi:hypothetical protein
MRISVSVSPFYPKVRRAYSLLVSFYRAGPEKVIKLNFESGRVRSWRPPLDSVPLCGKKRRDYHMTRLILLLPDLKF